MPAPQRPMRRAPQMRKTMPPRAAQVQRRAADATRPASGQAASRPTLPGQTGPGQSTPRETAHTPRQSASTGIRPSPACATSQLPAARRTSAQHSPDARPPGSGPTSAHIRDARLHPNLCPPAADEQTTTRKSAFRRSPQHAASASSPPPGGPPAGFRTLTFPAGLGSGAHIPAPALLPFPARIPTSPPRSALPLVPASDPPRFPRAFSCAFPALLPDSVPPFCASFVKNRNKLHAVAQNLCKAAHLRALRPGLRSNCPATSPAGHRSPT